MRQKNKIPSLFISILLILLVIEVSVVYYAPVQKHSQKAAAKSKTISLSLASYKKVTQVEPKPVQKPKKVQKPLPSPKQKLIAKPKPKVQVKAKAIAKVEPKKVLEPVIEPIVQETQEVVQESSDESVPPIVEPVSPSTPSAPSEAEQSAQRVELAKIDSIKAAYLKEIRDMIESNKHYPRVARRMHLTGIVKVQFAILKEGTICNIEITQRCKHKRLNRAAKKTLEKIESFKPLPSVFTSGNLVLNVPISYVLTTN